MPVDFKYQKRHERENPWHLMFCFKHKKQKFLTLLLGMGVGQETGVCTIDINGLPRIACRSVVRENDELRAMSTLPVITDLVVRRDQISRQLRGKIYRNQGEDLILMHPTIIMNLHPA